MVFGLGGRSEDASIIDAPPPCGTPDRERNPAGCACELESAVNQCFLGDQSETSACRIPGRVTCTNHVWSDCIGASMPSHEVCFDGIDNNCDGVVDEGCSCASGDNLCLDPATGVPYPQDHAVVTPAPVPRNISFTVYAVSRDPIPYPAVDANITGGQCSGVVTACTLGGACTGWFGVSAEVPADTIWYPNDGTNRVRILRNSGPTPENPSPCNPTMTAGAIVAVFQIAP